VCEKDHHRFAGQDRQDDLILLAGVDEAHGRLSGPETKEDSASESERCSA
jgi:hypothetical protein